MYRAALSKAEEEKRLKQLRLREELIEENMKLRVFFFKTANKPTNTFNIFSQIETS